MRFAAAAAKRGRFLRSPHQQVRVNSFVLFVLTSLETVLSLPVAPGISFRHAEEDFEYSSSPLFCARRAR
jgi:hypothetical protein